MSLIWVVVLTLILAPFLMGIARRTNTEFPGLAWIPVGNIFLMLMIARKPWWWALFLLIPVVDIIVFFFIWLEIVEVRRKPKWWVIPLFVPGLNFVFLALLAWGSVEVYDVRRDL